MHQNLSLRDVCPTNYQRGRLFGKLTGSDLPFTQGRVPEVFPEEFGAASRKVSKQLKEERERHSGSYAKAIEKKLLSVLHKHYGLDLPFEDCTSVEELIQNVVPKVAEAIRSGGIFIRRSNEDYRIGDPVLVTGPWPVKVFGAGMPCRGVVRDRLDCHYYVEINQLGHPISSSEFEPFYPFVLDQKSPLQDARRVVRKIIENMEREEVHKKASKDLVDILLNEKLIVESAQDRGAYRPLQSELYRHESRKLEAVYADSKLYSPFGLFAPLLERKPNVLRLEVTTGCSHNQCTYCSLYRGVRYQEKSFKEFTEYFDRVKKALGEVELARINRVFLSGGNALNLPTEELFAILAFLQYEDNFGETLRSVSLFGRTDAILKKGVYELNRLRIGGLRLIYWGVESGCQEVLNYVRKDCTVSDMVRAADMANDAGVGLSVMIMPGLGGYKYFESHAVKTAALLNQIRPKHVNLMCVNAAPNAPYTRIMKREMDLSQIRPLTDVELVKQTKRIISLLKIETRVAMYDRHVDEVSINPISFDEDTGEGGKDRVLKACGYFLEEHGVKMKQKRGAFWG